MISRDDIDAFEQDKATLREFVRRAKKGLHEDRLTGGTNGTMRLALACDGVLFAVNSYQALIEAWAELEKQRGTDSMEAFNDPCRK